MSTSTITHLVVSVTKKWAKQRKAEERAANARARRREVMGRPYRETIKDVAWEIVEDAYLKASAGGTLPIPARMVMYAARGEIQERTGRQLDDQYFIQTLLVDYISENADTTAQWDVVFDARGHLHEPHTDRIVPLGTLDVRAYLEQVAAEEASEKKAEIKLPEPGRFPTVGPKHRFSAILFIEKEGFLPLFERVKLAERYDLAIMSTKGMSVTASRLLIDELSADGSDLPLLVLHDFDKSGFSIVATLQRDTRRYEFKNPVKVVDLGLRLEDIKAYKFESEDVHYGKSDPTSNLADNGATEDEIQFLCGGNQWDGFRGRRVELNAFTSAAFIEWIEAKLKKHGVRKVIPDEATLESAYRRALEIELLSKEIEDVRGGIASQVVEAHVARDLRRRVECRLKADRALSWDQVVAEEAKRALGMTKELKEGPRPVSRPKAGGPPMRRRRGK